MIVGFDSGEKSAIAVLNLNGELSFIKSFRGGFKKAVELLREVQLPAIVASDKSRQRTVSKLATSFGAKAFFPKTDLKVAEKIKLVQGFNIANDHERDALAAALYTYKRHKTVIRRMRAIERDIFVGVLKGKEANPKDALARKSLGKKSHPFKKPPKNAKINETELKKRISSLERKLKQKSLELETFIREKFANPTKNPKKPRTLLSGVAKAEKSARIRLEHRLNFANTQLLKIEAEMQHLKNASKLNKEERVKDIRSRLFDMIRDYKERFK